MAKDKQAASNTPAKVKTPRKSKDSQKNDPFRFQGEGVFFKAKIIGIDDVPAPRGDKMCQESLQRLKVAVKSSGDHKKKVLVNVSLEGLKIFDEKTTVVTYTHKVHKISFIARDTGDPRAFGYVVGVPEGGHKFFALKTEKPAENLVMAIRDLFHTVFEMKKKEVELAKQKQKSTDEAVLSGDSSKPGETDPVETSEVSEVTSSDGGLGSEALMDLENELISIQQGMADITTKEDPFVVSTATPMEKPATSDPFITSFTRSKAETTPSKSPVNTNLQSSPENSSASQPTVFDVDVGSLSDAKDPFTPVKMTEVSPTPLAKDPFITSFTHSKQAAKTEQPLLIPPPLSPRRSSGKDSTLQETRVPQQHSESPAPMLDMESPVLSPEDEASVSDPFHGLCDIGSRKDKKDFFSELKTPQKRSLRELKGDAGSKFSMSVDSGLLQHLVKTSPSKSKEQLAVVAEALFAPSDSFSVEFSPLPSGEGQQQKLTQNFPLSDLFPSPTSDPFFTNFNVCDHDPFADVPLGGLSPLHKAHSSSSSNQKIHHVPLPTDASEAPFDGKFDSKFQTNTLQHQTSNTGIVSTDNAMFATAEVLSNAPSAPSVSRDSFAESRVSPSLHLPVVSSSTASYSGRLAEVPTPTDDPFIVSSRVRSISGENVFVCDPSMTLPETKIVSPTTAAARSRPKGRSIDNAGLVPPPPKRNPMIPQSSSDSTDSIPSPDIPPPPLPHEAPQTPVNHFDSSESPEPPNFSPPPLIMNNAMVPPPQELPPLPLSNAPPPKPRRLQKAQTFDASGFSSTISGGPALSESAKPATEIVNTSPEGQFSPDEFFQKADADPFANDPFFS